MNNAFFRRKKSSSQRARQTLRNRQRSIAEGIERLEDRSMMAALSYTTAGSNYTQDFNTLIETGSITPANVTTAISLDAATYVRSGQATTSLAGWQYAKITGATTRFTVTDGSNNAGGGVSAGVSAATERSLGLIASGSNTSRIGLVIANNTGTTLSTFTLSYTGEQWRDGAGSAAVTNKLAFGYSVGGTDINTGTFTPETTLDFTAPITAGNGVTGSDTVLVGNDAANRTAITSTVSGLSWANGTNLVIRWDDANEAGNDDLLSIDDLTFSAASGTSSTPAFTSASATSVNEGLPFSFPLVATGTPAPTFSASASKPAWVTIDPATGVMSGTAPSVSAVQTNTFDITATNSSGAATQTFTLTVLPGIISYATADSTYTQNFDTLPSATNSLITMAGNGPHNLVDPTTINAAGAEGWYFSKTGGTGANALFAVDDGNLGSGRTFSYGAVDATDRALGTLSSSTTISRIGAVFKNETTSTLNQFTLSYTGEQWRVGTGAANTNTFSYAVGGTSIDSGTFTNVSSLDFKAVVATAAGAALDGNLPANQANITGTVTGINWAPGQTLVIRWNDTDDTGNDDGLAIDNLSFSAKALSATAPTINSANNTSFISGTPGSFTVTSTAIPAATYSLQNAPNWLTIDSATGVMSGTPPTVTNSTPFSFTITATNGVNPDATQAFTLNVLPTVISYTTAGANYTQNFDSLPSTGTFTLTGVGPISLFQAPISATGLIGWQGAATAGTVAKFFVDTGTGTTGGMYDYGSTGTTERALGSISTSSYAGLFGAVLVNNTTSTLDKFDLSYTGEQWRGGNPTALNKLNFSYAVGATDVLTGTFTPVTNLDFTSPLGIVNTSAALNGNDAANKKVVTGGVATGLNWAPGQTLVIRWVDNDEAGTDDGLAIDDLTFSASAFTASPPTITSANAATVYEGSPFSFTVKASGAPASTFSASAALPPWLTLDSATGVLSGTAPSVNADTSSTFTITASNGNAPDATQSFTITVLNGDIAFNGLYTQDFDTLPSAAVGALSGVGPHRLNLPPINASGLNGWAMQDAEGTGNAVFSVSAGTATTGSVYSFGAASSTERALGSISSSGHFGRFGATFVNGAGATVNDLTISFTGEQWRDSEGSVAGKLAFSYLLGGTGINDAGTFTPVTQLDFTAPVTAANGGTATALDGNLAANQTAVTFTLSSLNWAPGASLVIRWDDPDDAGADDGLAIDNLKLSAPVTDVNSAPQGTDNTKTIAPDASYTFAAADFGFSDPNDIPPNALLAVVITTLPTAGKLQLNSADVTSTTTVPVAQIPNLKFVPAAGQTGTPYASFTFQVQDDGGTSGGGVDTDASPNNFTFNVTSSNTPPVITGGASAAVSTSEWKKEQWVGRGTSPVITAVAATDSPTDTIRFYLTSATGTDFNDFAIDATNGRLTFLNGQTAAALVSAGTKLYDTTQSKLIDPSVSGDVAGDFENPSDANTDNVYTIVVVAIDNSGAVSTPQTLTVTVANAAEAPYFVTADTDLNRLETFDAALAELESVETDTGLENPVTFTTDSAAHFNGRLEIRVRDDDNEAATGSTDSVPINGSIPANTLTYQVTGGADAALFQITSVKVDGLTDNDGVAGSQVFSLNNNQFAVLSFKGSFAGPDFDDPVDANGDGIFVVTVQVNDGTHSIEKTFNIAIVKQDDNSPAFAATDANRTLPENTVLTQDVTLDAGGSLNTITVTDADTTFSGAAAEAITLSIVPTASDAASLDASQFTIDASGKLSFKVAPNFEAPSDSNFDNKYVVVLLATDNVARSPDTKLTVTITVTDVNDPPVITLPQPGVTATVNVVENSTSVTTVAANDLDALPLKYRLASASTIFAGSQTVADVAPDQGLFTIDATTGVLTFLAPPDFEAPTDGVSKYDFNGNTLADDDAAGNNDYHVVVEAFDSGSPALSALQLVRVVVGNSAVAPTTITVQPDAANTPSTLDDLIVVQDTANVANQYRIYRDGTNIVILDMSANPDNVIRVTGVSGAQAFNFGVGGVEVASGDTGKLVKIPETTIDLYSTLQVLAAGGDDTVLLGRNVAGNNDFIPTNDKLSINLGPGVDTLDVDDHTTNAAAATWTISLADGGTLDVTGAGKLNFLGAEKLIGGQGADTFNITNTAASAITSINGDTGSLLDAVNITRDANITLTNTSVVVDTATVDQTFALANINRAFLTGGAGNNTFDLSGWTRKGDDTAANAYGGRIVSSGGVDTLIKSADLGTTPNILSRTLISTADGMKLGLVASGGLNSVTLTDTGTSNTIFEVGDWTKKATLNGGASPADVFQMQNTAATVIELGLGATGNVARINVTESNRITYNSVEVANISGTAVAQKVLIYSTAGGTPFNNPLTTINGAGGYDTFVYDEQTAGNLNFTPTDTTLSADLTGGGKYNIAIPGFEKMVYDGGGGDNVVDIRGWSGDGEIRGQNGTGDAVLAGSNADKIDLNQQSYVQTTGTGATAVVKTVVLKSLENFNFLGGAGNQAFTFNNWKLPATIDGGPGVNTLKAFEEQDSDFELDDVSATVGKINVTTVKAPTVKTVDWLYSNFSTLAVLGGSGANTVTLQDGFDRVLSTGAAALSLKLNTGNDTLNIGGVNGIDKDVTANRLATPSTATPSTIQIGTRVIQFATNDDFPEALIAKGGASGNKFSLSGLTATATIDGAGGTDSITITNDTNTWAGNVGATSSSILAGNATHVLANIETATLEMGAGNQDFTLTGTATNIANLTVNGNNGDDFLNAGGYTGTGLSLTLNGGAGNDILFGSSGNDVINGGDGNDWASGGDGNDTVKGGIGKDIVVGGNGLDNINGEAGEDIVISGRTSFDANRAAAAALLNYWATDTQVVGTLSSDGKTATGRVKGLFKDGVTVGSSKYFLRVSYPTAVTTPTVFDDTSVDVISGGGVDAIDWYFTNLSGAGSLENPTDDNATDVIAEL